MKKPKNKYFLPIGIAILAVGAVFMTSINPGVGLGLIGVGILFIILSIKKSDHENYDGVAKRDDND